MTGKKAQRGTSLMWAKVCNHAKTTPPSLSYLLCRCPIQPGVRNLIIYSRHGLTIVESNKIWPGGSKSRGSRDEKLIFNFIWLKL